MSEIVQSKPQLDWGVYVVNRAKWGVEELRPYAGQWLAWSLDGSRIVAHHADPNVVCDSVLAAGLTGEEVVLEGMPDKENFEALL